MNKNFATRLLSVLLCVLLALSCASLAAAEENTGAADREPYTVKIIAHGDGTSESCRLVEEELNKITIERFNTKIELVKGYTREQLNLILTSGEKLDIFPVFTWELNLANLANNGQILELDELLPQYAPDTYAEVSEADWRCCSVNGSIYGLPCNNDNAVALGVLMRKDVVDELGIDPASITTVEKLEEVLMLVKEQKPDMYPVASSAGSITSRGSYDGVGNDFGVIEDAFKYDTTFVNLYETEYFTDLAYKRREWNLKGLIMPDATSNTEDSRVIIGSGKAFCGFFNLKPGVEVQESAAMGTPVVSAQLVAPFSSTNEINGTVWAIAASSEKPERAMEILDLLYNDPVASNIFINGIEGVHYVYTDETKQVIDYPEGKDGTTIGYTVVGWAAPNQQITPVRVGDPLDLWERLNEFNSTAVDSPAKGFNFDIANVANEYTACYNVREKYMKALQAGALEPEETLAALNQELKDAGLETIIAEKQAQFDAWLAAQK